MKSSDYATQRLALLAQGGGKTWNTAFANQGSLLAQDTINGAGTTITVGNQSYATFAQAYVQEGVSNGEATQADTTCTQSFDLFASSTEQVSGACLGQSASGPPDGGAGGSGTGGSGTADAGGSGGGGTGGAPFGGPSCMVPSNTLDASQLACGKLDDLAVAFVGLHPSSVWLTRLESNLPHAALAADLQLQASATQTPVSNVLTLTAAKGDPCAPVAGYVTPAARKRAFRERGAMFGVILLAVAVTLARRRRPALLPSFRAAR